MTYTAVHGLTVSMSASARKKDEFTPKPIRKKREEGEKGRTDPADCLLLDGVPRSVMRLNSPWRSVWIFLRQESAERIPEAAPMVAF